MGVHVKELEITSSVPAEKMFKAFVLDADKLFPVVCSDFKSIECVEGDGGAGSVKVIHFHESEKFKFAKHKVHHLDKAKLEYHYTLFEGDALMNVFEKVDDEIKFHSHHGGSVCKITSKFHMIGDIPFSDEQYNIGKEKLVGLFKAVEAYVLAHPEY